MQQQEKKKKKKYFFLQSAKIIINDIIKALEPYIFLIPHDLNP